MLDGGAYNSRVTGLIMTNITTSYPSPIINFLPSPARKSVPVTPVRSGGVAT